MVTTKEISNKLPNFSPPLLEEMEAVASLKELKAGESLMHRGMCINAIPIVVSGSLKIMREDDDGKEAFLYFLTPGETCVVSLTCCVSNKTSSVKAVAEEDTEVLLVPVGKLGEWMSRYPSWKVFIFQSYQKRFEDMLEAVDSLAFKKMDERLWRLLKKKADLKEKRYVYSTHQELGDELSTSREVVTRLLKKLEGMGKIRTHRNRIEII